MIAVGQPLKVALAVLGLQAACSESDIVLGARGSSVVAMDPDSGTRQGTAGSNSDASAAAGTSGRSAAGESGGAAGGRAMPRPSTGCGRDPVLPDGTIEVDGMSASYLLDLPAAYDKTRAYPLVMAFRRSDSTAEALRESLGLPAAVGADAILVHPDCPNDASTWAVPDDLALVDALLAKLASSYCIDQDRVFAVGLGQGALLVNAFACVRSATLRGIAPLSAVLAPAEGACVGQAAVLLMQGSTEPSSMTFGRENRDYWTKQNGCDASMSMAVAPSPCVEYAGCDDDFPVRFCEYGSDLPGSTAHAIWDFFRAL